MENIILGKKVYIFVKDVKAKKNSYLKKAYFLVQIQAVKEKMHRFFFFKIFIFKKYLLSEKISTLTSLQAGINWGGGLLPPLQSLSIEAPPVSCVVRGPAFFSEFFHLKVTYRLVGSTR